MPLTPGAVVSGAAAWAAPRELIVELVLSAAQLALGLEAGEDGERSEPPAAGRGREAAALKS